MYLGEALAGRIAHHLEPSLEKVSKGLMQWSGGAWRTTCRSMAECSATLDVISRRLALAGLIPSLTGERYLMTDLESGAPIGRLDRAAATWFGIRTHGAHLNAYCSGPRGELKVWLARRSRDARSFPGSLDNSAAGGVPAGMTVREALGREAAEEATIPAARTATAQQFGSLSYCADTSEGLVDVEMAVFDLELPRSFVPRSQDMSFDSFLLVSFAEVERLALVEDAIKPNSGLALCDFLARHGWPGAKAALAGPGSQKQRCVAASVA
jgi:8-oxo-dGTP pyrophosphatase MutT (NUDIX family)